MIEAKGRALRRGKGTMSDCSWALQMREIFSLNQDGNVECVPQCLRHDAHVLLDCARQCFRNLFLIFLNFHKNIVIWLPESSISIACRILSGFLLFASNINPAQVPQVGLLFINLLRGSSNL